MANGNPIPESSFNHDNKEQNYFSQMNCLDLALLRIDPPFELSNKIQQIPLNDVVENLEGRNLEISGWGKTENEENPKRLRKTTVKVTEHPFFKDFHGIAMSFQQNTGLCQGDSGGKIYFNES